MGIFSFLGSLTAIWIAARAGRQADNHQESRLIKKAVITESLAGLLRLSLALLSKLASLFVLGILSFLAWIPYEFRNIPIYRQAYKLSEHFSDSKSEYSVCLEI